jgi:hypothetical protein
MPPLVDELTTVKLNEIARKDEGAIDRARLLAE